MDKSDYTERNDNNEDCVDITLEMIAMLKDAVNSVYDRAMEKAGRQP